MPASMRMALIHEWQKFENNTHDDTGDTQQKKPLTMLKMTMVDMTMMIMSADDNDDRHTHKATDNDADKSQFSQRHTPRDPLPNPRHRGLRAIQRPEGIHTWRNMGWDTEWHATE